MNIINLPIPKQMLFNLNLHYISRSFCFTKGKYKALILLVNQIFKKNFCSSGHSCLFAQPTSLSHSHLIKLNEITPGLTIDEYSTRRRRLMNLVSKTSQNNSPNMMHLVIIPSNTISYMSENIPYPFRQNTDFLYFTGFKEPNSVLLMHDHHSLLFIPKGTPHTDRWEGCKMDLITAKNFLGLDNVLYMEDFEKFLQSFAKSNKNFSIWYDFTKSPIVDIHQTMQDFITAYKDHLKVDTPRSFFHKLRLLKSESEISLMKKSCKIAAEAMREVMKCSYQEVLESHLHAKMEYECRIRGADGLSFPPVVAGEDRANTIHYISNNQLIHNNHMVLMDAGCEYHGYSSDLARTWPINGKFTSPQKELYEVILNVQEELIEMCTEKPPLDYLFTVMCQSMGEKLQKLGLISKTANKNEIAQAAYEYCPHHVSHYLGMDVHDTSLISRGIKLQTGMVITVEPGIYISLNNSKVPEEFRGLCVRIEDDILITENGYEILTSDCPKHVNDIENLHSISSHI